MLRRIASLRILSVPADLGGEGKAMQPKLVQTVPTGRHANERNDCTVRALAIAANIHYDQAHAELTAAGRKPGRGAYEREWGPVYERHGFRAFKLELIPQFYHKTDFYGNVTRRTKWITDTTLAQFLAKNPKGRFIVMVKGHVIPVIDGICHDTGKYTPRCRVLSVYKKEE